MSSHGARISWSTDGQFASGKYSRRHEWRFDGGAVVTGSSSPQVVPTPLSDPAGVDPEEGLVAAVSSCHMLWFLSLAQAEGLEIATYVDEASGDVGRIGEGRFAVTRIKLRPQIVFAGRQPAADEIDRLHHEAHQRCFIANSLKAEVVVEAPVPSEVAASA